MPKHQDPAPALRRRRDPGRRHAAALQYVRKVSGFRAPAAHNAAAFDEAVAAVTRATAHLLDHLEVRGARAR